MNAKHSAILLSGLLLLMIGIAWAQVPDAVRPTCPPVIYEANVNYRPYGNVSKWLRADWNANSDRWEIDCSSELPSGNATTNTLGPARGNAMSNSANAVWANVATNANMPANTPRPRAQPVKREPNTRRPVN